MDSKKQAQLIASGCRKYIASLGIEKSASTVQVINFIAALDHHERIPLTKAAEIYHKEFFEKTAQGDKTKPQAGQKGYGWQDWWNTIRNSLMTFGKKYITDDTKKLSSLYGGLLGTGLGAITGGIAGGGKGALAGGLTGMGIGTAGGWYGNPLQWYTTR